MSDILDDKEKIICLGLPESVLLDKFSNNEFRNESAELGIDRLTHLDYESNIRGRWSTRFEFLLCCIGSAVGFGNINRFPFNVYQNGGGTFIFLYFVLSFLIGVPLVIMEMGIGQFTSYGCTQAFKCVPILFGIGWTQVLMSSIVIMYYGVNLSWAYYYLFASIVADLPWSKCNNSFNTKNCIPSLNNLNITINNGSRYSTEEFFYRYLLGSEKSNGELYGINEYPGLPKWHLSICLLIVWITVVLSIMYGVKMGGKILCFHVMISYLALLFILLLSCTLPGAQNGISFYLLPNVSKLAESNTYLKAVEQLIFSLGTSMGCYIALASHNDFHDNFIRDAFIVVYADFFASFVAGLAIFFILGYMAKRTNQRIESVIGEARSLVFITYTEALSTIYAPRICTIILMVMIISLGTTCMYCLLETIINGIGDTFNNFHISINRRILCACLISLSFFSAGLFLLTPGGTIYYYILDNRVALFGLPIIAILQCIAIGTIYGHQNFQRDVCMMTGFLLHNFFLYTIAYICPLILIIVIVIGYLNPPTTMHENNQWLEVITSVILIFIMLPIFIGAIYVIIIHSKDHKNMYELLKILVTPPIHYGPRYKSNWLLDNEYKKRFIDNYKNILFLKHIPDVEDARIIYQVAKGKRKPRVSSLTPVHPPRSFSLRSYRYINEDALNSRNRTKSYSSRRKSNVSLYSRQQLIKSLSNYSSNASFRY